MILKRVIHGVDKNPMAVELAKVALWLHTFTVGAPLSFLDHHLRCGDSLLGLWVGDANRWLAAARQPDRQPAHRPRRSRRQARCPSIEAITDADVAEVARQRRHLRRRARRDRAAGRIPVVPPGRAPDGRP